MSLIYYKIVAAVLIFLISFGIALYLIKKQRGLKQSESMELGEALASGIFLGAAFFHMLPDSIRLFGEIYGPHAYPIPELVCVLGFLLLLFLERLSLSFASLESTNAIPYILAVILIIHALTEGAALGIGYTFSETLLLFIAISAHKGSESFALCITLLKHELPLRNILLIIIFFSLMTPLGISLGTLINYSYAKNGGLVEALFNAFAAGTFLYISSLHHIHFHEHVEDSRGLIEFLSLILGVTAMAVIALWT